MTSQQRTKSLAEGLGSVIGVGSAIFLTCRWERAAQSIPIILLLPVLGMIGGAYAGSAVYRLVLARAGVPESALITVEVILRTLVALICIVYSVVWLIAYIETAQITYLSWGVVVLALCVVLLPWFEKTYIPLLAGLTALGLNLYLLLIYGFSPVPLIDTWLAICLSAAAFFLRRARHPSTA